MTKASTMEDTTTECEVCCFLDANVIVMAQLSKWKQNLYKMLASAHILRIKILFPISQSVKTLSMP